MKQSDNRQRLDGLALKLMPTNPEQVNAFSLREQTKSARLLKQKRIGFEQQGSADESNPNPVLVKCAFAP